MDFSPYVVPSLWLIIATSASLLVIKETRATSLLLGIQYIGVFILVGLTWPIEMAVIKIVVGWLVAIVLGLEIRNKSSNTTTGRSVPWSLIFLSLGLALLLVASIREIIPNLANRFLNARYEQILGSSILIGLGLLKVGISMSTRSLVIGILTFLSGFEIIFATIDTSAFIAGFLAFLSLGVSLLGTYLSSAPSLKSEP